jgi:hypothetical protein
MPYRLLKLLAVIFTVGLGACGDDDPAAPQVTRLRVQNNSAVSIFEVYFTECPNPTWGADRLGATETIDPTENRQWDITAGCWDVRLVTEDDLNVDFVNQNIAAGQTHTITLTN